METTSNYGRGDATYLALGAQSGIRHLVDVFYETMEHNKAYRTIWDLHTQEREVMRDRLALFLCMWSGGPKLYIEKYGSINIPKVHAHLPVSKAEVQQWLNCMREALVIQQYPQDLIDYLIINFTIPAEKIRKTCEKK